MILAPSCMRREISATVKPLRASCNTWASTPGSTLNVLPTDTAGKACLRMGRRLSFRANSASLQSHFRCNVLTVSA